MVAVDVAVSKLGVGEAEGSMDWEGVAASWVNSGDACGVVPTIFVVGNACGAAVRAVGETKAALVTVGDNCAPEGVRTG